MGRYKSSHIEREAGFGHRLREARLRVGLSQGQLAFPGCSATYISRMETDDRFPSLHVLRGLAHSLDVSEDWLAKGRQSTSCLLRDAEIALRLGDEERAQGLFEAGLEVAETDCAKSKAVEGLGQLALRRGDPRAAIELLEEALTVAGDDPLARPGLCEALGRAYATVGELASAIALFRQCVEGYEHDDELIRYVRFACLLGYALTDSGNFTEAEQVVAKALLRGREVEDLYTRARLCWSRSRLLLEQGRSALAERYAVRTLELLRATEDTYALAHAYQTLGHIYLDLGRAGEAEEVLREGWPLISSTATPIELVHYQIEEARALAALGRREDAAGLAMSVTARLGDAQPIDAGRAHLLVAEVFEELGETQRAKELFELALEFLEQYTPNRYLAEALQRFAALMKREGRPEEALDLLERAVAVQSQAGRPLAV
ncbi:MAG: tetratricopeptide repeat protein [Gaiellaceae bacterium]